MKAKKSYGQHFLTNEDLSWQIADSLSMNGYSRVLEVGPGQGFLTKYLLKRNLDLLVVEADRDMVGYLGKNYPALNERIIPADFMKLDLKQFFQDEQFALIGNYPYNISSQILFKMLDYRDQIPEMVGMFQKEVAERVVAPAGNKTYGVISVLMAAYYEGEYLFTVGPENFNPPPKVQSAVIRLRRKEDSELGCDAKLFKKVVKQAFSQRRKMLRNTMKVYLSGNEILDNEFFKQRPEKLTLEDFVQLTKWVEEQV
jgi:16S rRNA (adenine1518-N6/adenine1519-N6)-dimethyltransferase